MKLVVAIVRYPRDLLPVVTDQESLLVNGGDLYLTPAYWRRYDGSLKAMKNWRGGIVDTTASCQP